MLFHHAKVQLKGFSILFKVNSARCEVGLWNRFGKDVYYEDYMQGPKWNGYHRCLAHVNFEILLIKTILRWNLISYGTLKLIFLNRLLMCEYRRFLYLGCTS